MITIKTRSGKETAAVARKFSKKISRGSVILLEGDLGSGKTTFVKGVAQGLGVKDDDPVTSPTFVIMRIYQGSIPLYHFDLYRLENPIELEAIGFEEFINDTNAVSCVEWPQKAADLIPQNALRVRLSITGKDERTISLPDLGLS